MKIEKTVQHTQHMKHIQTLLYVYTVTVTSVYATEKNVNGISYSMEKI